MTYRKTADVLLDMVKLDGRTVVDVGCGEGALARFMAEHGAIVTGIDPNAAQIARAQSKPALRGEQFRVGTAEALPLPDRSIDLVVFSNSLHHVPIAGQPQALKEAARVLGPGGELFIAEPLAEGSQFEMGRLVHDETDVRRQAYAAVRAAGGWGFDAAREHLFVQLMSFPDYEAFRSRQIAIEPERAKYLDEKDAELRDAFHRIGRKSPEGWQFESPTRVNLLRKAADDAAKKT